MVATAALTSFGTTSPLYMRQHAMYFPCLGSHLAIGVASYGATGLSFVCMGSNWLSISVMDVTHSGMQSFGDHVWSWKVPPGDGVWVAWGAWCWSVRGTRPQYTLKCMKFLM